MNKITIIALFSFSFNSIRAQFFADSICNWIDSLPWISKSVPRPINGWYVDPYATLDGAYGVVYWRDDLPVESYYCSRGSREISGVQYLSRAISDTSKEFFCLNRFVLYRYNDYGGLYNKFGTNRWNIESSGRFNLELELDSMFIANRIDLQTRYFRYSAEYDKMDRLMSMSFMDHNKKKGNSYRVMISGKDTVVKECRVRWSQRIYDMKNGALPVAADTKYYVFGRARYKTLQGKRLGSIRYKYGKPVYPKRIYSKDPNTKLTYLERFLKEYYYMY